MITLNFKPIIMPLLVLVLACIKVIIDIERIDNITSIELMVEYLVFEYKYIRLKINVINNKDNIGIRYLINFFIISPNKLYD